MRLSRDISQRPPWLTLALAGLGAALYAALGPAPEALVFDRAAIAAGEWWRLLTGHWVHTDPAHLGWNIGTLLLLGAIAEMHDRRALLAGLAAGSLGVGLTVWLALPAMTHYCGLSGVLNTLLLPVLFVLWRRSGSPMPTIIAALSLLKILVETLNGQALFTDTAWTSVPLAHLAGWVIGLGVCAVELLVAEGFPIRASFVGRTRSIVGATRRVRAAKRAEVGRPQVHHVLPHRLLGFIGPAATPPPLRAAHAGSRSDRGPAPGP